MISIEDIARVCHETNRVYCLALGDHSQPTWENAPDWQRDSARDGVRFHLAHPDANDEDSHENWRAVKSLDGWTYGETKDPEKKLHPCMVPFAALPLTQQAKDRLFKGVVDALRSLVSAP